MTSSAFILWLAILTPSQLEPVPILETNYYYQPTPNGEWDLKLVQVIAWDYYRVDQFEPETLLMGVVNGKGLAVRDWCHHKRPVVKEQGWHWYRWPGGTYVIAVLHIVSHTDYDVEIANRNVLARSRRRPIRGLGRNQ